MADKQTEKLTVAARIDGRTFVRFAAFDTLVRKRAWRNPLLFALILSAFAAVCFCARGSHAQAALPGGVLLTVGLLLPLVWFGSFFASASKQAKRSGLSADRVQYYVTLSPEAIHVTKGGEAADFSWQDVHMAYRTGGCIYLYVSAQRAFLLPDCEESERAWEIIAANLPPDKLRAAR